jgi:hypothetical protein
MKKAILRYGGYAALAELVFFVLTWVIIRLTGMGHKTQGYIGWVDLLCPLAFVYLGIRYYRDGLNNGNITFMRAIQIGLLTMLIPALAYALIETVYVIYIDPNFYHNIYLYDTEQYKKVLSPAQYAAKLQAIQQQLVLMNNPFYNFFMMVLTIASLGTIATVISALMLKRTVKATS